MAQVFGRKSWILFPPTCNIKSTRSPYEESSIYTKENFFSPGNYSQFLDIENEAYHVILEKGDILIVPKHWFHYVECLETSMNFNLWIKLVSFA